MSSRRTLADIGERKSFSGLAAVWAAQVERSIAERLGEQTTSNEAA